MKLKAQKLTYCRDCRHNALQYRCYPTDDPPHYTRRKAILNRSNNCPYYDKS